MVFQPKQLQMGNYCEFLYRSQPALLNHLAKDRCPYIQEIFYFLFYYLAYKHKRSIDPTFLPMKSSV